MKLTITIRSYRDQPPTDSAARCFELFPVIIGRSNACDYWLEDASRYLSSTHAIVVIVANRLVIQDTSANGVYVNGSNEPIGRGCNYTLRHGDTLAIGDYVLEVAIQLLPNTDSTKQPDDPFTDLAASPTRTVLPDSSAADGPFRGEEPDWRPPTRPHDPFDDDWDLARRTASSGDQTSESDDNDWANWADDVLSAIPFHRTVGVNQNDHTGAISKDDGDFDWLSGTNEESEANALSPTTKNPQRLEPTSPRTRVPISGTQKVEFAVFAPLELALNSSAIIDVWAFTPKQYDNVKKAASLTRNKINIGQKSGVNVDLDEIVTVKLEIRGLVIEDPFDTMTWSGCATNASFVVRVPSKIRAGDFYGKAMIAVRGITIAKVVFVLSISTKPVAKRADRSRASVYLQSAFASYASADREEVLSRVQGMRKIAPKLCVFIDVLSLRSGERWENAISLEVASKDVFFLFWSLSAARSEWVDREWRLALSQRGLNYINPVPLDEPSAAKPPAELSSLHFADVYLSYIKYERQRKLIATE